MKKSDIIPTPENTQIINATVPDAAERESIAEYQSLLNQQEEGLDEFLTTLDAQMATVPSEVANELTADNIAIEPAMDCELVTSGGIAVQKHNLLSLMSQIHNEVAGTLNDMRQSSYNAFFRPEDKFIPESRNNDFGTLFANI